MARFWTKPSCCAGSIVWQQDGNGDDAIPKSGHNKVFARTIALSSHRIRKYFHGGRVVGLEHGPLRDVDFVAIGKCGNCTKSDTIMCPGQSGLCWLDSQFRELRLRPAFCSLLDPTTQDRDAGGMLFENDIAAMIEYPKRLGQNEALGNVDKIDAASFCKLNDRRVVGIRIASIERKMKSTSSRRCPMAGASIAARMG